LPCLLAAFAAPPLLALELRSFPDQDQTPTIGVKVDVVSLDIEVLDRSGNPVRGLRKEDFRIRENGKPVEVTNFGWFEGRPVSLVLVLDTSTLRREQLLLAKEFISRLIHLLSRTDEIALYSYNEKEVFLEQDLATDRSLILEALNNIEVPSKRRRNLLKEAFGNPPPSGLSLDLAVAKAREGKNDKKAVALLSDRFRGLGPAVVEHVRDGGLTVLTVKLESQSTDRAKAEQGAAGGRPVADETGGREFRAGPEDAARVCRTIATALKNHYYAGYLTEVRPGDDKVRRIEVTVAAQDWVVFARRSFAPSR